MFSLFPVISLPLVNYTESLSPVLYHVQLLHRLTEVISEIVYVEGRMLLRAVMLLSLLAPGCGAKALEDMLSCSAPHMPFNLCEIFMPIELCHASVRCR